LTVTRDRDSNA